jgi:hypothetical protein
VIARETPSGLRLVGMTMCKHMAITHSLLSALHYKVLDYSVN